jgi:hypothetical protein
MPTNALLLLADDWSPPGPGVSYSVVDTDAAGSVTAKTSRLFLRGRGVLREFDLSEALNNPDGRVRFSTISGEAAANSVSDMLAGQPAGGEPHTDESSSNCSACGAVLSTGTNFCTKCGEKIQTS